MTSADRDNINSPAEGLVIYNIDSKCLELYNGQEWLSVCSGSSAEPINAINNPCVEGNPTQVVDITTPTGKTWMDRNLGAQRRATSLDDAQSFGSLYQWGRAAEGHQCINRFSGDGVETSPFTYTTLDSATPGGFAAGIYVGNLTFGANNWLSLEDGSLWQGLDGINNPCPSGYRLPTSQELINERDQFPSATPAGAFAYILKFSHGGERQGDGQIQNVNQQSKYWSSTLSPSFENFALSLSLNSFSNNTLVNSGSMIFGNMVRCIKGPL
jgi:hypothetical protein